MPRRTRSSSASCDRSLAARLRGNALETTSRHGKQMFVTLSNASFLVAHFGMTGYFSTDKPPPRFSRVVIEFDRGRPLAFVDARKLGFLAEPSGGKSGKNPIFVVQRHDASSLHFDFRLEIDGVLVSWAVPKGPSLDPRDKRLATRTEDHPMDYSDFEGSIAKGEYGAGTVIVWDTGEFENVTEKKGKPVDASDALKGGHLKFALHGEKLSGQFALTHSKMGGDDRNWLLLKVDDEDADKRRKPATTQLESVLSGKTNEDFEDA